MNRRDVNRGHALSFVGLLVSFAAGCDGPPAPATFKDEPVCLDFKVGASGTVMRGGLKHPISLRVLEGSTVVAKGTLYGLRDAKQPTKLLVPSGNNEYTIEWSQCPNAYAPHAVDANKSPGREPSGYICGDAKPYQTDKVVTKIDDVQSFFFPVPPPPDPGCWVTEAPAPPPQPTVTATAEPTVAPTAEPETSASAAPSGSAASSAAPKSSAPAAPSPMMTGRN